MAITLHPLTQAGCAELAEAFRGTHLERPASQIARHVDARAGRCEARLARWDGDAAGYAALDWLSPYPPFRSARTPEIRDLNVAPKARRRGVGSALLDELESRAAERSADVGIGFGLYADYGAAQRLYVRRGYVPDGRGLHRASEPVAPGDSVVVDDDLTLYLVKELRPPGPLRGTDS